MNIAMLINTVAIVRGTKIHEKIIKSAITVKISKLFLREKNFFK